MLWASAIAVATATSALPAEAPSAARFVGAERCKICHREIYRSWLETPHARTGTVELDDGSRCNSCHATDRANRLRGIQCEACHGPGGNYWPAEIMIDPDKASMAGLMRPSASRCLQCHANDEPGHRRDFVMPEGPAWSTFVHVRADR